VTAHLTSPRPLGRALRGLGLVGVALALLATQAAANERWNRNKGNCDKVFADPRGFDLTELLACTKRWEMHRDVADVDDSLRARMHTALDRLYGEGDAAGRTIALSAMKRLGVRPRAIAKGEQGLRREGTGVMVVTNDNAAPAAPAAMVADLDPNAPVVGEYGDRPPDRRRASQHYQRGAGEYKSGRFEPALGEFLQSADADPTWAKPLYLAAVCYARLRMDNDAIETLKQMRDLNSDEARKLMRRAGEDEAFVSVRARPSFKSLTGSAIIQILNGAGSEGEAKIRDMVKTLEGKGIPVTKVGTDANSRVSTYLYRKPGFEKQGDAVRRTLRLGFVHERQIDWPTPYDVILVYGKPKKNDWEDDEADKSAKKAAADKKAAEDAAAKKEEAEEVAKRAELRRKVQMMQMMQEMDAEGAAGQASGGRTPGTGVEGAIPPP
jgi:tetratricopeptide (TPR) repeat protein